MNTRRRTGAFLLTLTALSILIVFLLLEFRPSPRDKFGWLTPAQMAEAKQIGPLTRLKYKLEGLMGPLRRVFQRKPKALLNFNSSIWKLSADSTAQIDLGAPISTNADGTRAWILSAKELDAFRKRVKGLPDASPVIGPSMTTVDGMQCQVQSGNTMKVGGAFVTVGLTVDLVPKVSGDTFNLEIGFMDTETNASASAASTPIKTNFAVACRAAVPNASTLLIGVANTEGKHYWLVLTPVLVDAAGKLIKR
jgi:hypothetical protein